MVMHSDGRHFIAGDQRRGSYLDRICRIAARITRAPVAVVTVRQGRKLHVSGTSGIYLSKRDASWPIGSPLERRKEICFAADVCRDPAMREHPLLAAAPYTRSLLHVPVGGRHADVEAAISIVNPKRKWPFDEDTMAALADLSVLVGELINSSEIYAGNIVSNARKGCNRGFAAPRPAQLEIQGAEVNGDVASRFLLETLKKRASIRSRNNVSYVTLRTWSTQVKPYQLAALKIAKSLPNEDFADEVAQEIVAHVRNVLGAESFDCVVPVPCGHSGAKECLSVKLARRVAQLLQRPFLEALRQPARAGSSHPRKNAALKMPEVVLDMSVRSVLLVDDVATSGRHIELSVRSLRRHVGHVSAVAWLGS